ncbi:MAG: hypothetical protein ABIP53_05135 [Candidatus Limnocylindrales bacterium]
MTGDEAPPKEAPPKRGSRGCGVIGCLLIIGILVAGVVGTFFVGNALEPLADRYLWTPDDVVREYFLAYASADDDRARRFVCEGIKSAGLPDPSAPLGQPRAWTASVEDEFPYPRPNSQIAIYYTLRSGVGDERGQALLKREEGGWRICEFTD